MEIKFFHTLCFVRDDGTDSPHFQVDDEGLAQLRLLLEKYHKIQKEIQENRESVALCQVVGVEDGI
jgi:hypothetical protein